jgi:hypothetical protein
MQRRRQAHRDCQQIIDELYGNVEASGDNLRPDQNDLARGTDTRAPSPDALADQTDDLTHAFVRLSNLPTYPLDRLSRCEATLWRQACQISFALQCLDRKQQPQSARSRRDIACWRAQNPRVSCLQHPLCRSNPPETACPETYPIVCLGKLSRVCQYLVVQVFLRLCLPLIPQHGAKSVEKI